MAKTGVQQQVERVCFSDIEVDRQLSHALGGRVRHVFVGRKSIHGVVKDGFFGLHSVHLAIPQGSYTVVFVSDPSRQKSLRHCAILGIPICFVNIILFQKAIISILRYDRIVPTTAASISHLDVRSCCLLQIIAIGENVAACDPERQRVVISFSSFVYCCATKKGFILFSKA
jgi:hypothetical protein